MEYANLDKLVRAAHEFGSYIRHNTASLINYGERHRSGERISPSLAEFPGMATDDAADLLPLAAWSPTNSGALPYAGPTSCDVQPLCE